MRDCPVEDDRWVVATGWDEGSLADLLDRQALLTGPVKVVAPGTWRAEMPLCDAASAVVCAALDSAIQSGLPARSTTIQNEIEMVPEAAFSDGWAWERADSGLVLKQSDREMGPSITATAAGGCVLFRTPLLRRRVPESARDVLAHFLVGFNDRIRFARASRVETGVFLEVSLPAAALDSSMVREAVNALSAGLRFARRECSSLLDGQVARHYRQFHLEKEK